MNEHFDQVEVITSDEHSRAMMLTDNIRAHAEAMQGHLYEMCRLLKEVRDGKLYKALEYRSFEEYCASELEFTRRQAYNYIRIADNLPEEFVNSSSQIGVKKLTLLAMLDEPEREALTQNVDVESTTVRELQAEIARLKSEGADLGQRLDAATEQLQRQNRAYTELCGQNFDLEAKVKRLQNENQSLEGDRDYALEVLADTEKELEDLRNQPIDHVVVEDKEALEELERMRGLMEAQAEGFSKKEVEMREQIRQEYEEKLAAALRNGGTKEIYKVYLESVRHEVARLKTFMKKQQGFGTAKDLAFLEAVTTFTIQKMEEVV